MVRNTAFHTVFLLSGLLLISQSSVEANEIRVSVTLPGVEGKELINGRMLLILSTNDKDEPRFQVGDGVDGQQIFGIDVEDASAGQKVVFDDQVFGYPKRSLAEVPDGEYFVQALFHVYEVFHRKDGHVVRLPMDRGEGQQWNRAPGNAYSTPREVLFQKEKGLEIDLKLDKVIPEITPPADTM